MTNSLTIGSERLARSLANGIYIKSDPGIVALVEFVEGLSNAKSFNIALGGADIPRMAAERLKTWETGK